MKSIEEKEFCKMYSGFFGEEIDNIKQLVQHNFSGEELQEFVEHCIKQKLLTPSPERGKEGKTADANEVIKKIMVLGVEVDKSNDPLQINMAINDAQIILKEYAQSTLFSGSELRDIGIQKAMDHADRKHQEWTEQAYNFLVGFAKQNREFMAEDVREASAGTVPTPPSNRAWGGIFVRAVKNKVIRRKGFRNVTNSKAHCTPATLWETIPC